MQVLCKASEGLGDIQCPVCAQGFLVYWTRTSRKEREARRKDIFEALRQHHAAASSADNVHPTSGFNLPAWEGEPRFSAAALLGNAPAWAAR